MTNLRHADRHAQSLRLYRIGAASVVLFLVTGIVGPMVILNSVDYDTELSGRALLEFIAGHRAWWFALQNLTMGSMVFLILPLVALWPALMHGDRAVAVIGIVLAIACQVLFMAYFPVVNGLLHLSDRYVAASDPAARDALAGGAEALVAMNNAYGTSDTIFAVSVAAIAHAMRRSDFARWIVVVGYLTGVAGIVGATLKPQLGIHYLWWWAFFIAWLAGVGLTFVRLARAGLAD